jgi:ABC-2 type transport system permease protein
MMRVTSQQPLRAFTLVQRELREYRTSLVGTPLLIVVALAVVMTISVLLARHISVVGDAVQQLVPPENSSVSIHIDDNNGGEPTIEYRIEQRQALPDSGANANSVQPTTIKQGKARPGSLNPLLSAVHNLFLFVLILVCANYLLATLFTDRRDRSILFWKSMPVSEPEEVTAKYGVALVVAPVIFVAASLLAQVICTLLAMLLVWRMDMDPYQVILGNLDFAALLAGQLGGWLLMTLWIAPAYAWLLLASAAARRSPFMTAVAPIIGLLLLEKMVLGTSYLSATFTRHVPHYGGGSAAGFYWLGFQDLPRMALGLVFAAAALWVAVYLRRYRFEIQ